MSRIITETITTKYNIVSCYTCGVRFGIGEDLYRRVVKRKEGSVYCPSCGNRTCWTGKTDEQKKIEQLENKLKWEMEQVERKNRYLEDAKNSLRSTKGVVTKLKKRASAGVCPCCNRTFKQLAQHMENKHPGYVDHE